MKNIPKISEAEYEIMKIIWENAPISTNEVVEKLAGINEWSPKTVQTLLSRLVKKGVLEYVKNSRVFVYTPLVEEKVYLTEESNSFLERFYDGTLNSMVLNFLEQDKLTLEDIDELKRILENRKSKGEK
jgi:BlaI family penicillinase repressor